MVGRTPFPDLEAFLDNHVKDLVSVDFFTVPTATFRVLFVLVVLAHHRRRVIHFNVTEHPKALWTGQQRVEAFPEDTVPRHLIRDRDKIYGEHFRTRARGLKIQEVLSAPQSPWQNPFVERLVGSIRLDCRDSYCPPRGFLSVRFSLTSTKPNAPGVSFIPCASGGTPSRS
jgi:transposase InsO family protein